MDGYQHDACWLPDAVLLPRLRTAAFTNFNLVALGVIGTVMESSTSNLARNTTA